VMRRETAVLFLCFVGLVPFAAADVPTSGREPALILEGDMPGDLKTLVRTTWHRFVRAFPQQVDCLDAVAVASEWQLDDRAGYDPGEATVTVRIPGTAPNLSASLVHEFAHHLEYTCPRQVEIRSAFRASQELPAGGPWRSGPTWELTPSEQFAEAVAEYVLGGRPGHARVPVTEEAIAVIRSWAGGR
jgi:hypothetical protein